MNRRALEGIFNIPEPGRSGKPRENGFTMVLDKSLGLNATEDLVATVAEFIDFVKISFGTAALYPENVLRQKIEILANAGVDVYPGGTLLEVMISQECYKDYLHYAKQLGFTAIEVSDGTIKMSDETRADCIKRALDAGFTVVSEVGKKSASEKIPPPEIHRLIARDLELGTLFVIIEAREAGKGIGIYDLSGGVNDADVDQIVSGVTDLDRLMWEAPIKNQQQYLILRFGNNVNLGNIPPEDVLSSEALRQGLRGDTLKHAIARGQ